MPNLPQFDILLGASMLLFDSAWLLYASKKRLPYPPRPNGLKKLVSTSYMSMLWAHTSLSSTPRRSRSFSEPTDAITPLTVTHVPGWIPGARYKRAVSYWHRVADSALQAPHDKVKSELASGTAVTSVIANMLSQVDENSSDLEVMGSKMVPGTMYIAGADTTVAALGSFLLAMMLYPEVQGKAQAKINKLIGNDRLPVHSEKDALPYLQAVLKEV